MQGEEPRNRNPAKHSDFKSRRALVKMLAEEEVRHEEETESEVEDQCLRWMRVTKIIGITFVIDTIVLIPMLKDLPLHFLSYSVGKYLLIFWMCLVAALYYSAGIAYSRREYLKGLREISRRYPPPGSPYRKQSRKAHGDGHP